MLYIHRHVYINEWRTQIQIGTTKLLINMLNKCTKNRVFGIHATCGLASIIIIACISHLRCCYCFVKYLQFHRADGLSSLFFSTLIASNYSLPFGISVDFLFACFRFLFLSFFLYFLHSLTLLRMNWKGTACVL